MTSAPHVPHLREAEAAEYVLGTLNPVERDAFARELVRDPALAALVRDWEERLVPLAETAPALEPGPGTWTRIAAATRTTPGSDSAPVADNVVAFRSGSELAALRRSRTVWRRASGAFAALAAALVLFIATDRLAPSAADPALIAVVNRAGDLPALVVRVDPRAGIVQVRSLAAETPADHSLELWSVAAGAAPRSLGVVSGHATRLALRPGERSALDGVTLAVSVEPKGGSPTGAPTGPVVYTGKLVRETP